MNNINNVSFDDFVNTSGGTCEIKNFGKYEELFEWDSLESGLSNAFRDFVDFLIDNDVISITSTDDLTYKTIQEEIGEDMIKDFFTKEDYGYGYEDFVSGASIYITYSLPKSKLDNVEYEVVLYENVLGQWVVLDSSNINRKVDASDKYYIYYSKKSSTIFNPIDGAVVSLKFEYKKKENND